ncbi:MAG: hypothetical protein FJ104_10765 [Deltaproteobacteria bacterium]|nr:hypothetical protein [Deltaproteobacteria bacterium]
MNPADLDTCLRFWAPIVRLADYEIHASLDPALPPDEYKLTCDHTYKRAAVRIGPGEALEECLLRALVRMHMAPLGSGQDVEEERAAASMARGFLDLRRGGAPPSILRSRVAPRLRAASVTTNKNTETPMDEETMIAVREALRANKPNDAAQLLQGFPPETAGRILGRLVREASSPANGSGPADPGARARTHGPMTQRRRAMAAAMGIPVSGDLSPRDERGRRRWPVMTRSEHTRFRARPAA